MLALSVQNLSKVYPPAAKNKAAGNGVQALTEVSFDIQPGEIFGLLGPNGAGKTSLISILTSLENASSGSAEIFGVDVGRHPLAAKQQVGVVPQEIVNHGFFNLTEILTFQSGFYGLWNNRERVDELLHDLDLWNHRFKMVKNLSGGMKRRLMIAKALVHRPKLLLLDEPTAGVDVELRQKLWVYVRKLQSQGTTVLLTTHYLAEAEELCERVGILSHGVLKYLGKTRGIIEKLTLRSIEIDFKIPLKIESSEIPVVQKNERSVRLSCPHGASVGDVLARLQIPVDQIQDIRTREGSLEEAFLQVIEQGRTK